MASAGAEGFPSAELCGRCEDLCVPPAGGDRAFGATCELSAGSSHWARKSFPAERRQKKSESAAAMQVCSHLSALLTDMRPRYTFISQQTVVSAGRWPQGDAWLCGYV